MKRIIGEKKLTAALLAAAVAGSMLLCACNQAEETTTETTTEATTTTSETTTEPSETTEPNGRDTTPYQELKLDGEHDHYFETKDFCYIESEKYILFLEKDLAIPGDFVTNIDAIVDEIEKQMGLPYAPANMEETEVCDMSYAYGFNPWDDWRIGSKIGIFISTEGEKNFIGCTVYNNDVTITERTLYTKAFWESINTNGDLYRDDYVHYQDITNVLAHCIADRNSTNELSGMMSKGISDLMSRTVIDALADKYPAIKEAKQKRYLYDAPIPEVITAKNAETTFVSDYYDEEQGYGDPNAQEVFGRYFCMFLKDTYGDDFYQRYNTAMNSFGDSKTPDWIIKNTFGEDAFTKFGDWCKKHKALQSTNGVW